MKKTGLLPHPAAKFFEMGAKDVARNLPKVLPKLTDPTFRSWDPVGTAIPNEKWLRVLVQYLAENEGELGRNEIEGLPIVPDQLLAARRRHLPI
jgi:hypothetical protein